jgi:chemotaxis protein CheY-P-specific phosphatase CheC
MGSNMASAYSTEQDTLQDMGSNMASAYSTEQDTLQDMGSNMASAYSTDPCLVVYLVQYCMH